MLRYTLGNLLRVPKQNFRRRDPRYISSIPVTVQRFLRYGPFVTRGVTLDASVHGMAALVCGAPQAGETVLLGLALQHTNVEILARVPYSSAARSGFEFYPLEPDAERALHCWIHELSANEEILLPLIYRSRASDS